MKENQKNDGDIILLLLLYFNGYWTFPDDARPVNTASDAVRYNQKKKLLRRTVSNAGPVMCGAV